MFALSMENICIGLFPNMDMAMESLGITYGNTVEYDYLGDLNAMGFANGEPFTIVKVEPSTVTTKLTRD